MSTPFEIPTSPEPQSFTITLNNVVYTITLRWNSPAACWIVDIGDINNVPIVTGMAMVTGADLLEQFEYLGFVGELLAQSDNSPETPPTFASLGTTGHLYYLAP